MMLHLGIGAPIAALVAWLMFGAVLGATSGSYPNDRRTPRHLALGTAVAAITLIAAGVVGLVLSPAPAGSSLTATRILVTEPAQAMPEGVDYFSVLELTQPPGATLGPHAHPYAGFAYGLNGVATIDFTDGPTVRVAPGDVGFIATQAGHAHRNTDDQLPTAALALLIVALATAIGLLWFRQSLRAGRLLPVLPVLLVLLIGAGALGALNPWQNDWLFLSVRAGSQRGGPMPLPTASRIYESADLGTLAAASYVQTLEEITIAPGESVTAPQSTGPALLLVVDGQVAVQLSDGSSSHIGGRQATLLQPDQSAVINDAGAGPARLLRLVLTPA
jgi:quercetin dioxygenase-like cupin family protein